MKLKNYLTIFLLCSILHVQAQDSASDRLFQTLGYHLALGFYPAFSVETPFDNTYSRFLSYDIGYDYGLRFNLYQINDNNAIGAEIMPSIGLDYGSFTESGQGSGLIGFNFPVMVSFNTGAGSTYDSTSDFGFGFSAGLDINYLPLAVVEGGANDEDFKKFYAGPTVQLGIRRWKGNSNSLSEFFMRYTWMKHDSKIEEDIDGVPPMILLIGWNKFLNY